MKAAATSLSVLCRLWGLDHSVAAAVVCGVLFGTATEILIVDVAQLARSCITVGATPQTNKETA